LNKSKDELDKYKPPGLDSIARDIVHEHEVILNGGFMRSSGNPFVF